ncbi:selenocysteine-specific translation elongation factor [Xylophilus sp. GOD-11R]|uniref:selenocysteine-specific translation elongation factor n=1 Tax=Xylophilus sp. GOD-11R TaxID=3089814 RepID=UPI00298C7D04|nr:selenocysteine-specific translation elongation factor [Xylophilus sp. GOD-11R]WPB55918.1 selenocysteine-specific translation elongation factor [Xylophilus sp. GOD-11R]
MIIATAGHIDHGKTTLVGLLTGVDTDRLPEEKARGISIEPGFAHCELAGHTVAFVDVPGHERFVRNMLGGVYAVGHVLLVVAADDGVMPQTREHLQIVDLLGVAGGTLVITKCDRVDEDRLAHVRDELRALVRGTVLRHAALLEFSAPTRHGLDLLRDHLTGVATAWRRDDGTDTQPLRYVVDRAFTIAGSGTVVTGTVIAGSLASGDQLLIAPSGKPARVRKLQRHGGTVERARAGERCAVNLSRIERSEVRRGDWLVEAPARQPVQPVQTLDIRLRVLDSAPAALRHWAQLHVHVGAADVPARLALPRGAGIAPGESGFAQLRLARPVHAAHGDRIVLRDQSASITLAGGVVLDSEPGPTRAERRAKVLQALSRGGAKDALPELLAIDDAGLDLAWVARVFNLRPAQVQAALPPDAVLVQAPGPVALPAPTVERLMRETPLRLARFHAEQPAEAGMPPGALRGELARSMPGERFVALLRRQLPPGVVGLDAMRLRLVGHDPTDNPRDTAVWQRVRPHLMQAGHAVPAVRQLAKASGVPYQQLREFLHRKSETGPVVRLSGERFALAETVHTFADLARTLDREQAGGGFGAAGFRDAAAVGRNLAIEVLEHLDRIGVTRRSGDLRRCTGPDG